MSPLKGLKESSFQGALWVPRAMRFNWFVAGQKLKRVLVETICGWRSRGDKWVREERGGEEMRGGERRRGREEGRRGGGAVSTLLS